MTSGFEQYDTKTLVVIAKNLMGGLTEVAKTIENGTFHTAPDTHGACPPSQAGQTFLFLFKPIVAELKTRQDFHPRMLK